jgi:hypothetical protein
MNLLLPGCLEPLKREVHRSLGILAGVCLAYNLAAFALRRSPHLGANAVAYALLLALEVQHVHNHHQACQ